MYKEIGTILEFQQVEEAAVIVIEGNPGTQYRKFNGELALCEPSADSCWDVITAVTQPYPSPDTKVSIVGYAPFPPQWGISPYGIWVE